jgi:putative N6-adenine-specific DNA methylase
MHKIGLKPSSKIRLFNGALECSFQKFELFDGKRKLLIRKNC